MEIARMETDVDLAIRHAIGIAHARRERLASVTLCGGGSASAIEASARTSLRRHGSDCGEVRVVDGDGPVRLALVEFAGT